jgi:tetratricopeptide (TPR) repeat protein
MDASEMKYRDYLEKRAMVIDINDSINKNTDKQILANALFSEGIKDTIVRQQVATAECLNRNFDSVNSTLIGGFTATSKQLSDGFEIVERSLGRMGSEMNMGFIRLNGTIQKSAADICEKLDSINNTLNNPIRTKARELYRQSWDDYTKGFYDVSLKGLEKAVELIETDYISWFLIGRVYLLGLGEFADVVNLDKAILSLTKASKYIAPNAKLHKEAAMMAAEICFHLGLALQSKGIEISSYGSDAEHHNLLTQAIDAYTKSYTYSQDMLESVYNRARCKLKIEDTDGSIQDMENIIEADSIYVIKCATDSDFDTIRKDIMNLLQKMKPTLYPEVHALQEEVSSLKVQIDYVDGELSEDILRTMNTLLQNDLSEGLPYFDVRCRKDELSNLKITLEQQLRDAQLAFKNTWIIENGELVGYDRRYCTENGHRRIREKIVIPSSVTSIGPYVFSGHSYLASVVIPSSVTSIGQGAFKGCSSLISVIIPSSVTSIELGAFKDCTSLASVVIPSSVTNIEGNYVIAGGAFEGCSSLTSVVIPSSVTSIGESAFKGCSSLASVVIPSSVTSIGQGAFEGCSSLASVVIPSSVTSIGYDGIVAHGAFEGCSSLASVVISSSVTSIGKYTFEGCSSLASVVIPSSVTSIGRGAFKGCSSLTSVVIPSSVSRIGSGAFDGCSSLASVVSRSNTRIIKYDSFGDTPLYDIFKDTPFYKIEQQRKEEQQRKKEQQREEQQRKEEQRKEEQRKKYKKFFLWILGIAISVSVISLLVR